MASLGPVGTPAQAAVASHQEGQPAQPGVQVAHAADLDLLVGNDVAGEGSELRLEAAARLVELLHHRERSLVRSNRRPSELAPVGLAVVPVRAVVLSGERRAASGPPFALLSGSCSPSTRARPDPAGAQTECARERVVVACVRA
jgi:hypothetical protein